MGFESFPQQESLPDWLNRIVTEAEEKYKNELQNQEIQGDELEEKVEVFNEVAKEMATEKKNEWGEVLANLDTSEEDPEDAEDKLAKGLVIITKGKMKEAA